MNHLFLLFIIEQTAFFWAISFPKNIAKGIFKICFPFTWALFPFDSLKFYIEGLDVDTVEWMCSHWILGGDGILCVSSGYSHLQPASQHQESGSLCVSEVISVLKHLSFCYLPSTCRLILELSSQKLLLREIVPSPFNQVILTIINSYSSSWWMVEIIKLTIHEVIFASQLIVLEYIKVTRI